MKYLKPVICSLFILLACGSSLSIAGTEVKGTIRDVNGSRIEMETTTGAIRHFEITEETVILRNGKPVRIHRAMRNSSVVIVPERGKAKIIFIKGAPK